MTTVEDSGFTSLSDIEINHADNEAPMRWLEKGFEDFKNNLGLSLLYGGVIAAIGAILALSTKFSPSFIIGAITGFVIVGPFAAIGLYDMAREMEFDRKPQLHHAISALKKNTGTLLTFAFALGFLHTIWTRLTGLLLGMFFEDLNISSGNLLEVLSQPSSILFLALFMLIGAVVVSFAFAISVISIPMIMHRDVDLVTAAVTSLRVVKTNPRKMFTWAAMIGTIMLLGMATAFIGLIVAFPIVGYASWHAYRDMVVRPADLVTKNGPIKH